MNGKIVLTLIVWCVAIVSIVMSLVNCREPVSAGYLMVGIVLIFIPTLWFETPDEYWWGWVYKDKNDGEYKIDAYWNNNDHRKDGV